MLVTIAALLVILVLWRVLAAVAVFLAIVFAGLTLAGLALANPDLVAPILAGLVGAALLALAGRSLFRSATAPAPALPTPVQAPRKPRPVDPFAGMTPASVQRQNAVSEIRSRYNLT